MVCSGRFQPCWESLCRKEKRSFSKRVWLFLVNSSPLCHLLYWVWVWRLVAVVQADWCYKSLRARGHSGLFQISPSFTKASLTFLSETWKQLQPCKLLHNTDPLFVVSSACFSSFHIQNLHLCIFHLGNRACWTPTEESEWVFCWESALCRSSLAGNSGCPSGREGKEMKTFWRIPKDLSIIIKVQLTWLPVWEGDNAVLRAVMWASPGGLLPTDLHKSATLAEDELPQIAIYYLVPEGKARQMHVCLVMIIEQHNTAKKNKRPKEFGFAEIRQCYFILEPHKKYPDKCFRFPRA